MRALKTIPLAQNFTLTIFQWNGKYILKYETLLLELTYKIPESEVTTGLDGLEKLAIGQEMIEKVIAQFKEMDSALSYLFELV